MCDREREMQESEMEILDLYLDGCSVWYACYFFPTFSIRAISSLRSLCLHNSASWRLAGVPFRTNREIFCRKCESEWVAAGAQ